MFDQEKAMKVWAEIFGNATRVNDENGLTIMKTSYADKLSRFGWVIQHKIPKNKGGTDDIDNLKIVNIITQDYFL